MKLFSIAIGEQYEKEALRLQRSVNLPLEVFTNNDISYKEINKDSLINGLWHKCNFANYIEDTNEPIIFMDADMFTLTKNPFETFEVKVDTDIAFVPYKGKWFFPDVIRQELMDYFGYKVNSGFIYFRTLEIAKDICNSWTKEYLKREKIYNENKNISKYEYDEYALMLAIMKKSYKIELLDSKWNNWELNSKQEILNSKSIFFQSHEHLDII